ncbi:hypothetical protein Tco_1493278 [Tanacetum coccineum]
MTTSKLPSLIGIRSISKGMTSYEYWLPVASSGWPFVSAVPGEGFQYTYCFSWGDSISPDGFLPSIRLLLVIIVAVAIVVTVILVVVVVVGEGSSIIKLSFVIIGSLHRIVLCYLIH